MDDIVIVMQHKKSTKGTEVYEAKVTGQPPAITSLYIAKFALPTVPREIEITVRDAV